MSGPGDTCTVPRDQPAHDADRRQPRSGPGAERKPNIDRAVATRELFVEHAEPSECQLIVDRRVGLWVVRGPSEDRRHDEVRVAHGHRFVEPERTGVGRPDGMHHDVGVGEELVELAPTVIGHQIDFDAALATPPRPKARFRPQLGTTRWLDHDDIGPRLGQHHRGGEAGDTASEVDDADAVERCNMFHWAQPPTRRNDADTVAMVRPPFPSSIIVASTPTRTPPAPSTVAVARNGPM